MTIVIINPNATVSMTDAMLEVARASAPDLAFEGWTSHDGPAAIQGEADGVAATAPLLALVDRAVSQGAKGIIVGCFDDTALQQAAARAPCPVIGIGQAAFLYCALRQWRFSVVTTLDVSVPIIDRNIAAYGLGGILGRVHASGVPVLDLERDTGAASADVLAQARSALAEDDVAAIVLGCAGMVEVVADLRTALPCHVVDPVSCAARAMAWLAA